MTNANISTRGQDAIARMYAMTAQFQAARDIVKKEVVSTKDAMNLMAKWGTNRLEEAMTYEAKSRIK